MVCQAYITKNFQPKTLETIEQANAIIAEYQEQGFALTLRQLYYQFVARDLIANKHSEYKRIGGILNDARMAGLVDWSAIEDRTRNLEQLSKWDSPKDILRATAQQFRLDIWAQQQNYVEVWIEKEALVGVIESVCEKYRVPYFACRGNTSQSEQWNAGQRFIDKINEGKTVHVLHLGDHDPSGIDMTRDNDERLKRFLAAETDEYQFSLKRLALNMDQIKKFRPPPNPAKESDSRFDKYVELYGKSCWELDALDPTVISNMINNEINALISDGAWVSELDREEKYKAKLAKMAKTFKE